MSDSERPNEEPAEGPKSEPDDELRRQVELLKSKGEHAAAAAALWASGYSAEAAAVYEHIFEDERALRAYEEADDLVGALRVALRMADAGSIERVVSKAIHGGRADGLLHMLEQDERHAEVARVHLARGDLELAASSFKSARRLHDAAQCLESMGDLRGAGLLYERHLEADPTHPEACLRLGRILARFSRHDDAITLLQRAVKHADDPDEMRVQAAPTLVLSFTSLGYDVAAEAVYERWRRSAENKHLEVPGSLDEYLHSESAAAFAAVVSRQQPSGTNGKTKATGLDAFFEASSDDEGQEPTTPPDDATAGGMLLAGRYLLGEPLGGGGVGQVFRAFDAFTDRAVAVKIFGSQAMQSDAVKAYAREARAASALDHPAVASLVELNMPQGFVVTELVDGSSVEQRLREGGSAAWLRPFAHAILDVLAECHRVGLVHGALKPTNVFLIEGGGVRVVDFGAHHLLALRSTETGGLSSVWPYLAPEQLFGATADARADLYALAAMLYRALTGRPPFARAEDDRRSAPPRPSLFARSLAGPWDEFLLKALSADVEDRYPTARDMREAMPPVPEVTGLPQSETVAGEAPAAVVLESADRYAKGPLVFRERSGTRVFEGRDLTVGRPVWIVETEAPAALQPLAACSRITRGLQPVYDVLPESARAVVARDPASRVADLASLRDVPQHLTRDLSSVAHALFSLHELNLSLGGFSTDRGRGPVGPRLRLAPAPLPVERTDERVAEDWRSFVALVDEAFGMDPSLHTDPRRRLLVTLERSRVLSKDDVEALSRGTNEQGSWTAFLDDVTERLVAGARGRVIARLAATVLRG